MPWTESRVRHPSGTVNAHSAVRASVAGLRAVNETVTTDPESIAARSGPPETLTVGLPANAAGTRQCSTAVAKATGPPA